MVSLHAEVSAKNDIMTMHDIINDVEEELKETLQCNAIIHMDPVITDDHQTNMTREAVLEALKQIDERISIHDFRLIKGKKHPRIFFDVVVPFDVKDSDEVIHQHVQSIVLNLNPNFITNIVIDRN
ncbi:hypothetical protein SDC9_149012 [bioreactor metagenome]|uniref:Cation efflux protein cytoplasmic domain-containing protein n=1 Tax=bioreactor metagenome TaxID=1076179 RepID=A0A645EKF8_9ZZZZ